MSGDGNDFSNNSDFDGNTARELYEPSAPWGDHPIDDPAFDPPLVHLAQRVQPRAKVLAFPWQPSHRKPKGHRAPASTPVGSAHTRSLQEARDYFSALAVFAAEGFGLVDSTDDPAALMKAVNLVRRFNRDQKLKLNLKKR